MIRARALGALAAAVGAFSAGAALAQSSATDRLSSLKLSNSQPIQIESDNLEVDEQKSLATFTGNVSVVQGPTNMKAGKMVVYYKNDGKGGTTTGSSQIDRLEVSDKVYVKSGTQVATGDRGDFNMNTNVLTLSGKEVVLSDGPNVLRGCKLTVLMDSGQANVVGCNAGGGGGKRVQVLIDPTSNPN